MVPPSKLKKIEDFILSRSRERVFIDVRSESEYREDHIPGAISHPVLNDDQRKNVGTMHKENSFEARQMGAKIISANLPGILTAIETIASKSNDISTDPKISRPLIEFVIYCWRGGMRSRSLFTVMDLIGYKTSLIDGGYKSYRRAVNTFFSEANLPDAITIYGPSGSGKTSLIELLKSNNLPAISLEKIANHKGSLLGGNFSSQPSQKQFDTTLFSEIQNAINSGATEILLEGESRRIGNLSLPKRFYEKMLSGKNIWVELPIEVRANRLAKEYNGDLAELTDKIILLKKHIGKSILDEILKSISVNDRYTAAYLLLKHHYDKYYQRGAPEKNPARAYSAVFRENTFESLSDQILNFLKITKK